MRVTCPICDELYDINWPPENEHDPSSICPRCNHSPKEGEARRMISAAEALVVMTECRG